MNSIEILSSNFSEINLSSDSEGIITLSQKKTAIMSQKLLFFMSILRRYMLVKYLQSKVVEVGG